jgi:hypothetical protein
LLNSKLENILRFSFSNERWREYSFDDTPSDLAIQ